MVLDPTRFPRVLTIYLELSNYPILAPRIRERMRRELFKRKVIQPKDFESEVRQKAIQSQYREGLVDPLIEEPPDTWAQRISIVRDHLTDFYFAYNLPHDLFEELLREVLSKRIPAKDVVLTFHPELAPWDMLFAQGSSYESLPPEERKPIEHHLKEIKVVLIKAMISDHLDYVGIAKEWFDIADLKAIRRHRYGRGKIGGKAAGMMLAECILRKTCEQGLLQRLRIPRSWFLGADVFYQFTQINELLDISNQKYRSETEIIESYPRIYDRFLEGTFPEDILDGLQKILKEIGQSPLIVRSSSLLEDSFGTSFAGKYESHFCPNQRGLADNLGDLCRAISSVYASVYSPDAILYRRRMKLLDYDERMAILIQEVKGRQQGRFFLPDGAGVAFSRNQYRWHPRISREEGFVRLVWGLGTRAVDQIGGDYPRLVALSHPDLRPEVEPRRIQRYSQQYVDLIDLEENTFKTLPISDVIHNQTPFLRYLAQEYDGGHLKNFVSAPLRLDPEQMVLTFDGLLRRSDFPQLMSRMLRVLEEAYSGPVDTEFVVELEQREEGKLRPVIHLVQCRPQSHLPGTTVQVPQDVPSEQRLFSIRGMVPDGTISDVHYIVIVQKDAYTQLEEPRKKALARLIGRINQHLAGETYILIGPGRWGSVNPALGIPVTYSDIYHSRALIEMVEVESAIEPSYGTHFFQDLVEAQIFILPLALDHPDTELNEAFLDDAENLLGELLPQDEEWSPILKVIDVPANAAGQTLNLVMDGDAGLAMAWLSTRTDAPTA